MEFYPGSLDRFYERGPVKNKIRSTQIALLMASLILGLVGSVSADPKPTTSTKVKTYQTGVGYRQCQTLTNAPMDINSEQWFSHSGPRVYELDEGRVRLWAPSGRQPENSLGAMGADREFVNLEYSQRLGVWANGRLSEGSPRSIVTGMVGRAQTITGGTWTEPVETFIAGVPVAMATGYDLFGNYFFEVIALERFGHKYAFATRVPANERYSVKRNAELAWIVTHIHPSNWTE